MIVMPANSTGGVWTALARETGRLGHLYSPGGQRGPWPWFPYALDNGCFALWSESTNAFDEATWRSSGEAAWRRLVFWAQAAPIKPMWAICPDVPGNAAATLYRWHEYVAEIPFPLALAVQDGMEPKHIAVLTPEPAVICVGGSKDWKWSTVGTWAAAFPRVHLLRCNRPTKLSELEAMGVASCDGTGWNRGDRRQSEGIEAWARLAPRPITTPLWPYMCRGPRDSKQGAFA